MKVVLVCGGRSFSSYDVVEAWLDKLHAIHKFDLVIHGNNKGHAGKPGADQLADQWARGRHIDVKPFDADWKKYGKPAGPIRNKRMLDEGKPNLVIAFPGGRGTTDMKRQANAASVCVIDLANESVRIEVNRQWQATKKVREAHLSGSATGSATSGPSAT